jgi:poly(3-hydroxybutyrate) depolymerase
VAFLDSLAAALQKDACVDRVYAFGFSSGGQMANRWNCEGDQIDGAIGAAGSLLVPVANCKGPRPMLAMVGTKDDNFREGSTESALSTPDSLETHWGQINQCSGKGTDTDVGDATCTTLKGCAAPTQLCVVKGGAHDVPAPFSEKHPTTFDGPDYGWSFLTSTN